MRKRGKMKKTFVGAVAALLFMFCFSLHPVSAQAAEHMLQMEMMNGYVIPMDSVIILIPGWLLMNMAGGI